MEESCRTCIYWYEEVGWCKARELDMPDWEGCDEYRKDPIFDEYEGK